MDVQMVVDQFNEVIQKLFNNQAELDARLKELENPSKPRIYIP